MEFLCLATFIWPMFGVLGFLIAKDKEAGCLGALLGFLLGPFGLIAAFFIDQRPRCPKCYEHVHVNSSVCPHCRNPIAPSAITNSSIAVGNDSQSSLIRGIKVREFGSTSVEKELKPVGAQETGVALDTLYDNTVVAAKAVIQWMRNHLFPWTVKVTKGVLRGIDSPLLKMAGDDVYMLWFFRSIAGAVIVLAIVLSVNFLVQTQIPPQSAIDSQPNDQVAAGNAKESVVTQKEDPSAEPVSKDTQNRIEANTNNNSLQQPIRQLLGTWREESTQFLGSPLNEPFQSSWTFSDSGTVAVVTPGIRTTDVFIVKFLPSQQFQFVQSNGYVAFSGNWQLRNGKLVVRFNPGNHLPNLSATARDVEVEMVMQR